MKRAAALAVALAIFAPQLARAAPKVWAIDDGEKIKQDAIASPLATGVDNPVWSPGQPIRLFATKNETVAVQIVVGADEALEAVTVDLDVLASDAASIRNAPGASDPTKFVGRPIERFVEHFFDVRRSGGKVEDESLGWTAGSGPPPEKWTGKLPDALIPVEVAPPWSPYPMKIAPRTNGIVWIDVTVPKSQAPGVYKGTVVVKNGAATIASLSVELTIADVVLPDRPVRTMLYYDRSEIDRRIAGGDAVEDHLWMLFHRHRLTALHQANAAAEVARHVAALDGSLYTAAHGYEGAGEAMGDGVLALGMYGHYKAPDASKLAIVEKIADELAARSLLATTDTFVYAIDEKCSSPYGAAWKALVDGSQNANAKRVRVAWTCNDDPSKQPVDVPITPTFDPTQAAAARAAGKEVWVYNGALPSDGTFLTDTAAITTRVNGWLLGMFDIGRWFYWETTFWYDDNKGGRGAYDPFTSAETFHNSDGDFCMGDGVLVYPGKQVDMFTSRSIGMNGVVASIRLKNWRRGVEDAGYYQLARAANRTKAEAVANALLPRVLAAAAPGKPPAWSESGKAFYDARKALLDLIPAGANGGAGPGATTRDATGGGGTTAAAPSCGCRGCSRADATTSAGAGIAVVGVIVFRRRRHDPARRRRSR